MNIPNKTLNSGFSLPVYGLGTWEMGGRSEADHTNDAGDVTAIKMALDHGISHIDTAEMYGAGHSEELVGEAIQGYERDKLIIATKVSVGMSGGYNGVIQSCQASLKRLGTDYLDLYLLHRFPATGIADIMRAMDKLVADGLARNIGVCNMTINRFEAAQKLTQNKLVCNQVEYSLRVRESERRGIINYCQANDVMIAAWGPVQKGMLQAGGILDELAHKYNKTPYQIALNWLLSQPNVVTIPKTTKSEHLEENLGALGWELDVADVHRLTKDFPDQLDTSERVPLDYPADTPA
jgi:diketogulonate reductase-like aldo/keto reductase